MESRMEGVSASATKRAWVVLFVGSAIRFAVLIGRELDDGLPYDVGLGSRLALGVFLFHVGVAHVVLIYTLCAFYLLMMDGGDNAVYPFRNAAAWQCSPKGTVKVHKKCSVLWLNTCPE